jgi:hypothetical protein
LISILAPDFSIFQSIRGDTNLDKRGLRTFQVRW